jgi:hypothetical protein
LDFDGRPVIKEILFGTSLILISLEEDDSEVESLFGYWTEGILLVSPLPDVSSARIIKQIIENETFCVEVVLLEKCNLYQRKHLKRKKRRKISKMFVFW